MGQAQSDAFHEAVQDTQQIPPSTTKPSAGRTIKLYKYVAAGQAGQWTVVTNNARPRFYDANEDSNEKLPNWHMEIEGSDVDVRVDPDLGYMADLDQLRMTFGAHGSIWALRFGNEEQYKDFNQDLNDKAFSNMYGKENDETNRAKELGDDYADMFFTSGNVEHAAQPMDTAEDEYDADKKHGLDEEQAKETQEGDEDSEIQGLVIGGGENNYLMRGKHFDVLRNVQGGVEDKQISFMLTPTKTPSRGIGSSTPSALTPSRVLLANAERNMILLTPDDKQVLHQANIETGKVVATWKFQKDGVDIPMKEIHHDDKVGQLDERSTFMGLDANRLTRWDMRDPHGMVAKSPILAYTGGKDFARNTNFTCMATTGDGYVAVGSQDGKIRMYSHKTLTKANTAIPGLGSPITAIDVTYDGKWVLATTDRYLMLVKTTYTDDKGREGNAFINRMGGRGSVPRLLRLKPEDVALTRGKPFQKAKFTWITEAGQSERWVVAQCGNYSVIWNFKRIRSSAANSLSYGGLPTCVDYVLSGKDQDVVDAAFLHPKYGKSAGHDTSLVVATSHKVFNLGA